MRTGAAFALLSWTTGPGGTGGATGGVPRSAGTVWHTSVLLSGSQWTACITVAICLAWLLFVRRTPRWGRWDGRAHDADTPSEPAPATQED